VMEYVDGETLADIIPPDGLESVDRRMA
jgi:hypothetical protein